MSGKKGIAAKRKSPRRKASRGDNTTHPNQSSVPKRLSTAVVEKRDIGECNPSFPEAKRKRETPSNHAVETNESENSTVFAPVGGQMIGHIDTGNGHESRNEPSVAERHGTETQDEAVLYQDSNSLVPSDLREVSNIHKVRSEIINDNTNLTGNEVRADETEAASSGVETEGNEPNFTPATKTLVNISESRSGNGRFEPGLGKNPDDMMMNDIGTTVDRSDDKDKETGTTAEQSGTKSGGSQIEEGGTRAHDGTNNETVPLAMKVKEGKKC